MIHRELCKKLKFDEQMVYAQHRIRPEERDAQTSLGFTAQLISPWQSDLIIIIKERTCRIVNFAVPANHNVKLIENEKKNTWTLLGELKKPWNIKVTRGSPPGVMVKAMDSGIVVSEFKLQSSYYINFRTNILGKSMNPLIPHPPISLIVLLLFS